MWQKKLQWYKFKILKKHCHIPSSPLCLLNVTLFSASVKNSSSPLTSPPISIDCAAVHSSNHSSSVNLCLAAVVSNQSIVVVLIIGLWIFSNQKSWLEEEGRCCVWSMTATGGMIARENDWRWIERPWMWVLETWEEKKEKRMTFNYYCVFWKINVFLNLNVNHWILFCHMSFIQTLNGLNGACGKCSIPVSHRKI